MRNPGENAFSLIFVSSSSSPLEAYVPDDERVAVLTGQAPCSAGPPAAPRPVGSPLLPWVTASSLCSWFSGKTDAYFSDLRPPCISGQLGSWRQRFQAEAFHASASPGAWHSPEWLLKWVGLAGLQERRTPCDGRKTETCALVVLERRSPKSGCQRAHGPLRARGEGPHLHLPAAGTPWCPWLVAASSQPPPRSPRSLLLITSVSPGSLLL